MAEKRLIAQTYDGGYISYHNADTGCGCAIGVAFKPEDGLDKLATLHGYPINLINDALPKAIRIVDRDLLWAKRLQDAHDHWATHRDDRSRAAFLETLAA